MPTHDKRIFVRLKKVCLFWEMCLLWEKEDFASRCNLYRIDSSIRIGLFVYNFFGEIGEEMVSLELIPENEDQKMPKQNLKFGPALHNFSKIIENLFFRKPLQNNHIFVWVKSECLLWEMCLLWVCLL